MVVVVVVVVVVMMVVVTMVVVTIVLPTEVVNKKISRLTHHVFQHGQQIVVTHSLVVASASVIAIGPL